MPNWGIEKGFRGVAVVEAGQALSSPGCRSRSRCRPSRRTRRRGRSTWAGCGGLSVSRRAGCSRGPRSEPSAAPWVVDFSGGSPVFPSLALISGQPAAAVDDHVDAAEGEPVPARLVGGVAQLAGAVVGGVDVEAAVRLAQRPDVGGHLLLPEEPVEPDQVFVAVALGDRARADQLAALAGVAGGDVQDRPRPRLLPAFDRLGEVRAPGAEALEQRRVLVQRLAELAEVGRVAGVADAEEDLLALGQQRAGLGARGRREAERQRDEGRQGGAGSRRVRHPSLIRPGRTSLPAGGADIGGVVTPARRRGHRVEVEHPAGVQLGVRETTSCSTSSAYLATKVGPTPLIPARPASRRGGVAAIAASVLLWATV